MKSHDHNEVLRNENVAKNRGQIRQQKEEVEYFRQCPKFQEVGKRNEQDFHKAVVFLNLIQKKCDKRKAIVFSQRKLCKFDSTLKKDGPASCRILKPYKSEKALVNGWQNVGGELKYDMGDEYQTDMQALCIENDEDRKIMQQFAKNEARIKNDYKSRIKNLQKYLHEMNEKYCFSLQQKGYVKLKERIQEANRDYKTSREQPVKYIQHRGVNFMNILQEVKDNIVESVDTKSQDPRMSKIVNPFTPLVPLKKKFNLKSKLADDLFIHLNKQYEVIANTGLTSKYKRFEDESKLVMKMADPDGNSDLFNNGKFKMKSESAQKNHLGSDKELFAQEFNKGQYLFEIKTIPPAKNLNNKKIQKINEEQSEYSELSPQKVSNFSDHEGRRAVDQNHSFSAGDNSLLQQQCEVESQSISQRKYSDKLHPEKLVTRPKQISSYSDLGSQQKSQKINKSQVEQQQIKSFNHLKEYQPRVLRIPESKQQQIKVQSNIEGQSDFNKKIIGMMKQSVTEINLPFSKAQIAEDNLQQQIKDFQGQLKKEQRKYKREKGSLDMRQLLKKQLSPQIIYGEGFGLNRLKGKSLQSPMSDSNVYPNQRRRSILKKNISEFTTTMQSANFHINS